MKVRKEEAIKEVWDNVESRNYKLTHLPSKYQSIVYAKLTGSHGEVHTSEVERVYYVLRGEGEFNVEGEMTKVVQGDVFTVPPQKTYNYYPLQDSTEPLEILLFMELWNN